jgi:hypothetical protein
MVRLRLPARLTAGIALGSKESAMNDLLNFAIEAHDGLKRWKRVEATVATSITGELWQTKSKPDCLKNVIFNAETKRERFTMDFSGQDKRSVLMWSGQSARWRASSLQKKLPSGLPRKRLRDSRADFSEGA